MRTIDEIRADACADQFARCEHAISIDRVDTIQGEVRTFWRCPKCRAYGMIDFPDGSGPVNVLASFLNNLAAATAREIIRENEAKIREMAARSGRNVSKAEEPSGEPLVYIARNTRSGNVKIGVSVNPAARISSLQTATVDKIEILFTLDGGYSAEKELHERFADARLSGEWFGPSPELLSWIAARGTP